MSKVRFEIRDSAKGPLFPCSNTEEEKHERDIVQLTRRCSQILKMHKFGGGSSDSSGSVDLPSYRAQLGLGDIRKLLDRSSELRNSLSGDDTRTQYAMRRALGNYVKYSLRLMFRRSTSNSTISRNGSMNGESKHAHLHEFLRTGDTIGLTFRASTLKLSSFRAWPNMHKVDLLCTRCRCRLQKQDKSMPDCGGRNVWLASLHPSEDKPGKALFFLVLSYYEESPGRRLLIASKLLEGTHYVLHPNGSAMFIVNVKETSVDQFHWSNDADNRRVRVKHAFFVEGIANGYGFRYPGSKPGSPFVLENGMLAFI